MHAQKALGTGAYVGQVKPMRGRSRPYADILRQKAQIKDRTEYYELPHRLFRVFGVFVKLLRAEVSGNRLEGLK